MNLKELRKSIGLSQAKAAEFIGMPLRTLQDWECNKRTPPDYVLKLVIEKLKTYTD